MVNPRDRAEAEDMLRIPPAHAQDLKGNLKDMIQTEIQRLQILYQNIDSLLQEGKERPAQSSSHSALRDPPAASSERQTLQVCHSGAGFASDNTGRS